MRSFPRGALPITIHHSGDAELIFIFVPAKCHLDVGRMFVVDPGSVECECPLHLLACEDHSREICLLQKFDEPAHDRRVMANYINKTVPPLPTIITWPVFGSLVNSVTASNPPSRK